MYKEFLIRALSSIVLLPIVFYFIIKGSILFNFFILVILLITLYEWYYLSFKKVYYIPGLIFIFFSFYTFYVLRNENSYYLFILILLICIATDVGGYLFGKIFKGPKLTKISPNKTYAGMIGGFILSILLSMIYFNYISILSLAELNQEIRVQTFFLVLSISLISQLGDILISFFKRKLKIKNTGKIIPGHGGILDRIDGMIFAFPYVFILIKIM